jgi:hypothetical protein
MSDEFSMPARVRQAQDASLDIGNGLHLGPRLKTHWRVECFDRFGAEKWIEDYYNLIVTAGLNKILDATFKTGLASPAWFLGLKGTGTVVLGDTMGSHGGWLVITPYSNASRPAFTPGTISGGSMDNSASKGVFNINTSSTVYGAFICDSASGTSGVLYGAGDFNTPRTVESGDTLNLLVTLSAS